MIVVNGVFKRVRRVFYYAYVELEVEQQISEDKTSIVIETHGKGFFSQGYVEEVPANGYTAWKAGAVAGIEYALRVCAAAPCHIVISIIEGFSTDTNPTVVAAAAIEAVWKAFDFQPTAEHRTLIEELVFNSWNIPDGSIPQFP